MATIITPLAQTFFVDSNEAPDGMFVAAIDVCFNKKDNLMPITLRMTGTTNGYPDITKAYYGSDITLSSQSINLSEGVGTDLPIFTDSSKYTRFRFYNPIYLPPGEHAFTLSTNSVNYDVWIAKMSQTLLGTDRVVSKQPYSGSLFKSQNGSTWTADQESDIMFRIMRAKFDISSSGVIYFQNSKKEIANANSYFDSFTLSTNDINFGKTKIRHTIRTTSATTGSKDSQFVDVPINTNIIPTERKVVSANTTGSFEAAFVLSSTSDYVSPVIDTSRVSGIFIKNIINDASLKNNVVYITNSGSGYNPASPPLVSISAPTRSDGVQAGGVANVTPAGLVDFVYITTPGSGYIETPTLTIDAPGSGVTATGVIIGETSRRGGNALARYISRKVTLADGFDARDLKVFITANRFPNHDIQLYYKILSVEDPDQNFDNKYWTRMSLQSNSLVYSQNIYDFVEYTYVPTGALAIPPTNITYVSNGVTYDTFKYFAIKICLFSSTRLNTPVLRDLRAIALE
jgi:hypothetical protein